MQTFTEQPTQETPVTAVEATDIPEFPIHWITLDEGAAQTDRADGVIRVWIQQDKIKSRRNEDGVVLIAEDDLFAVSGLAKRRRRKGAAGNPVEPLPPAGEEPTDCSSTATDDEPNPATAKQDEGGVDATDALAPEPRPDADQPLEGIAAEAPLSPADTAPTTAVIQEGSPWGTFVEETVEISTICVERSIQVRAKMDPEAIEDYAEKMRAGETFPPVVLFREGENLYHLADGGHRVAAARKNGDVRILAHVYCGGPSAALRFALRCNLDHGVRLTSACKRRKVALALGEYPSLSNVELAKVCAVSESLVRSVREADTFAKNEAEKRLGGDGKLHPARKRRLGPTDHADKQDALYIRRALVSARRLTLEGLGRLKKAVDERLAELGQTPSAVEKAA